MDTCDQLIICIVLNGSDAFMFQLYPYDEALSHVKIVNTVCPEQTILLHIPEDISQELSLYNVYEVDKDNKLKELPYTESDIYRDEMHPWLEISKDFLNTSIGYHMYKFSFTRAFFNDIITLYFIYHIQSSDTDKSYVYMNREVN